MYEMFAIPSNFMCFLVDVCTKLLERQRLYPVTMLAETTAAAT
jgi:hypothetical protein